MIDFVKICASVITARPIIPLRSIQKILLVKKIRVILGIHRLYQIPPLVLKRQLYNAVIIYVLIGGNPHILGRDICLHAVPAKDRTSIPGRFCGKGILVRSLPLIGVGHQVLRVIVIAQIIPDALDIHFLAKIQHHFPFLHEGIGSSGRRHIAQINESHHGIYRRNSSHSNPVRPSHPLFLSGCPYHAPSLCLLIFTLLK